MSTTTGSTTTTSTTAAAVAASSKGGIAWGGSLVGSKNPHNLGYRYSTPHKRFRAAANDGDNDNKDPKDDLPANMVVQLSNRQGQALADAMDLPTNSTISEDWNALLHSLLSNTDDNDDNNNKRIPYSFYAKLPHSREHPNLLEDVEITTATLAEFLLQQSHLISTEQTLQITYQPMAVFRVRPVTRCTDTLPGHTEAVLHVSYSPHGRQLASGGGDTTVRFWDVHTNLPKFATAKVHKDHVLCTAWSPDGTRFASVDKRGMLVIWNPTTGESIGVICAHKKWITSLAWEPLHNAPNRKSCDRLVTAGKDGTAKIWNVRTRQHLATLSGHTDSIECVKWGGENLIYTASRDRTIKVWNATTYKLVRTLQGHGHRVNTLACSSDYICRTGPFDPNNKELLRNSSKNTTDPSKLYDLAVTRYKEFQQSTCPTELLVSGSDDYTLFLWSPVTSKHALKRLTGHQNAINHLVYSPDGRFFASASFDKKVKLWAGHTGEFLQTLTGHVGAVYQVAWSADSQFLVSASADSTTKLWRAPGSNNASNNNNKTAVETLPGHADQVFTLDWSPNGTSVATGSKDRTIKIWKH